MNGGLCSSLGSPASARPDSAPNWLGRSMTTGATVLAGRCDEDLGVPFQPFVEALRHLVSHVEPSELPKRLGRHAGELERLLPGLRDRLPDAPPLLQSDPETERYRLFEAVTAWLAACSCDEPVLMILDDLQWAAKPTLLLLRHVLRSSEPMKLLIVGHLSRHRPRITTIRSSNCSPICAASRQWNDCRCRASTRRPWPISSPGRPGTRPGRGRPRTGQSDPRRD